MIPFELRLIPRISKLAAPVMVAMISQTLINQVDHVLVGHLKYDSKPGQTALMISQILLWMFGGFLSSVAVGTQSLSARRRGEDLPEAAGKVALNSFVLSLIASIVISVITYFLSDFLFRLMNKDEAVLRVGIPFVKYRFLNIPAMVLFASMKSFFDAIGKTKIAMVSAIAMNVVNFFLCIALVFGGNKPNIWGIDQIHSIFWQWSSGHLPEMGLSGAGLAALISSYIGMVIIFVWTFSSKFQTYKIYRISNLSLKLMKEISRLSIPSGLATIFAMIGFGFVMYVVGKIDLSLGYAAGEGINSTATSNIISILMLIFISGIAYGTATATLVSQSLGAKKPDLAEKYAYTSVLFGVFLFAFIGLSMILKAEAILQFWNNDVQVLQVGAPILRVVGFTQPFIIIAIVFMQGLYGAGNTRFVMAVEFILHLVCLIPLCYFLGITLKYGLWGAWLSLIIYVVALATVMFAKFRTGSWKHIKI